MYKFELRDRHGATLFTGTTIEECRDRGRKTLGDADSGAEVIAIKGVREYVVDEWGFLFASHDSTVRRLAALPDDLFELAGYHQRRLARR